MKLPIFLLALSMAVGSAADHPNIVFILVDDMGYGDVGAYNPESKIETPQIDSLAQDGMRFTDAHAPGPLCHMSRYGLMTGRAPYRIEVGKWRTDPLIEEGEVTVPSLLADVGYETAMVGKWHVGFQETGETADDYLGKLKGGPFDRGFQSFFGIRASTDIPPYFFIRDDAAVAPPTDRIEAEDSVAEGWSPIQGRFWREGGIAPDLKLEEVMPRFTDEAIEVIEKDREKPLFLYLAYPAPHTPWLPSKEFADTSEVPLYGDFISMVDAEVGRVLTALKDQGMAEDTLVIFSSDNGPTWYDSDVEKYNHDASGGLRGMKADAWEGGHRVPFLVRWPGRVDAGSVTDETINFTDVLATFATLVETDLPDDAAPDSISFYPALLGVDFSDRPPMVIRSGSGHFTIRDGDWKYIDKLASGGFTRPNKAEPEPNGPTGQLYDLSEDLGEENNLFLSKPAKVKQLEKKMKEIIDAGKSR